jgi:DNA-binding transcriptional ArsR family regulator
MPRPAHITNGVDTNGRAWYFTNRLSKGRPLPQDPLSQVFAALADPTRRAILARLAQGGETSVTELAKPFDMSLPAVTKHLKVLQRAGLITQSREAQWRPCKLSAGPLRNVADWVSEYRQFWEESFDRLEEYLQELQQKEKEQHHGDRNKK